jgi:p-hydroxybenzoate 3-monooxygenase
VVIDLRPRDAIEETIKAGVLEQGTVDLMTQTGVGERLKRDGFLHHGINLAFSGGIHRINMYELTGGRAVTVYAQHEVLKDLIAKRLADGGDVRFGISETIVEGLTSERPTVRFVHDGEQHALDCDFVAGCDGSRTYTRFLMPSPEVRTDFFRQYPFAWFGILAEVPPSSDELIYAHSERGFALISTRSPNVQRLYFQCDPDTNPDDWTQDQIWDEIQARVTGAGATIKTRTIFQKAILQFRSFVCEPMQYGRLFLPGDAAHTVPPTGARGLNLAQAPSMLPSFSRTPVPRPPACRKRSPKRPTKSAKHETRHRPKKPEPSSWPGQPPRHDQLTVQKSRVVFMPSLVPRRSRRSPVRSARPGRGTPGTRDRRTASALGRVGCRRGGTDL